MSLYHEISFETEICDHLAANGWLYSEGDAKDYDRARALFPADVTTWIQDTQGMGGVNQEPRRASNRNSAATLT